MKDVVMAALVSIVVSVVVLFTLGPVMMKLNADAVSTPPPARVETVKKTRESPAAPAPVPAPVQATAPNIEGMLIRDARERWRASGTLIIEDGDRVDTSVQPGTILEQNPRAGAPLERKEIRTIVARAPELIGVPNVVGTKLDDAREKLVEVGFEVPPETREPSEEPGGTVLRQEPNPGAQTEKGSLVRLVVAAELIEVPKLRGKRLSQAKTTLEKRGLELGRVSEREDEELSGKRVLEQTPASGERVEAGTTVDLVIVAPD